MNSKNYKVCLKDNIEQFSKQLFYSLFDACKQDKEAMQTLETEFLDICEALEIKDSKAQWDVFCQKFPSIREQLDLDAIAFEKNDPAANSLREIYLAYPGFYAISMYRLSHQLLLQNIPIIPRMMSEFAHGLTGTDIHPGASIGASFFIDHATGIVIGETSVIKNNVKIYQGVTLGGIEVKKSLASTKRHPTIENNVTIYANATILGGAISIGENSIIGANVWITKSIPSNSLVTYRSDINIKPRTVE
ncbi:MAG: serine acetyltransferase [Flavobacteriaceae bacterium]|nr:MAG: serine acetyltransferase [Flavobacteriaceae bacterium]